MAVSDYTLNLLKGFEGYTAKPKWDHKQYSVGYSTRWEPGTPHGTREDHEEALRREAGAVDSYIDQNIKVPLSDQQRAALTSFGYNLGPGAIGRLLPDINSSNWDRVGQRMMSFTRAGDNPNALVDRRRQEVEVLSGAAPADRQANGQAATTPSTAIVTSDKPNAPQEGNMLQFLSALGSSGNLAAGLGKAFGSQALSNAGNSGNLFGSLSAMFGGEDGGGAAAGSPSTGNTMGDQNMKLAQGAQQSAAGGQSQGPQAYQRKPVDLANLMKILQQRAQMGTSTRQPGPGLGA